MPRFSFNRGNRDNDLLRFLLRAFNISGQPSSSPTTNATVPHSSHPPAHLQRTAPTILHTSDAPSYRFVACTAPLRLLLLLRPTTTITSLLRSRALSPEPLRVLRATITYVHYDSVQSACIATARTSRRFFRCRC
ncbi:hypothetical protein DEO72_LG5g482 [Vigna unguiculata]|uniref:Uncharacterized protein n=1 Tax=Vigna unguiculata TaxID=3917 RepID=A0A4D6LTR6_VIGUN|nr:hypothetical protein DEO72_LG5g482 [Vigna unguiculata]